MRRGFGAAGLAGFGLASLFAFAGPVSANIVIAVDKAAQRMSVTVDGKQQYLWKVSTGTGGAPRAGTYRPQRLEKSWFSRKYDMSPMPNAIFFDEGIAIHGTQYVSRLGAIASHGCVRLHPTNAATLFNLVRTQGMAATTIVVTHSGWPDLAKIAPKPVAKPELKLQAAPEAKPGTKPAAEAPIKANLPAAVQPKADAATAVTTTATVTATKPDRVLMERVTDTPPGTSGEVVTIPLTPPSLASSGSEPVKLQAPQQ